MGDLTADQMVTELQRRLTSLDSNTALSAINASIEQINRATSYTFQANSGATNVSVVATAPPGIAATAGSGFLQDLGKAMTIVNSNGTPVRRVSMTELWMSQNFNVPTQTPVQYDTYAVTPGGLMFMPNASGTVALYYTAQSQNISGGAVSNLPRDFDRLVVDLAEAEERRIYDIGDWQTLYARCKEELKLLADAYKSMTNEAGGVTESANQIQEETQLGRA